MKFCKKCKTHKLESEFYPSVPSRCKICRNIDSQKWKKENPSKWIKIVRKSEKNISKDVKREWCRKFHKNNPDWMRNYYQENRHIWILNRRLRAHKMKMQTPLWADMKKIKQVYKEAKEKSLEVDHIIPLQGKFVSGLHVETNLQLLPKEENRKKSNKYDYNVNYDFKCD